MNQVSQAQFLTVLMLFFSVFVYSQNTTAIADVPPSAEPGKCYARCYIPDEYSWKEVEEIDRPGYKKIVIVPAVYKTVIDTIVVRPASKKLDVVPAVYETVTDTILLAAATTKWVRGKADPNCLSADPEDCQVLCLVEVPAQYKFTTRKILKTPAHTRETNIPPDLQFVPRRVLVTPETTKEIDVAPTYKTTLKRVVSKKGGYNEWKEVLCGDQVTEQKIREIQRALNQRGYDPGPADNILGPRTKEALRQYQTDNNLPVGNLNIETLRALGVQP